MVAETMYKGEGSMPEEFLDYILAQEWGITMTEYRDHSDEDIGKIKEYRRAKAEGEDRKRRHDDAVAKSVSKK